MRNSLVIGEYCAELGRRASEGESASPQAENNPRCFRLQGPRGARPSRASQFHPVLKCLRPSVVQVVDHIYVRMPGWLSAQMRMIRWQFGMLMGNDVRIFGLSLNQ